MQISPIKEKKYIILQKKKKNRSYRYSLGVIFGRFYFLRGRKGGNPEKQIDFFLYFVISKWIDRKNICIYVTVRKGFTKRKKKIVEFSTKRLNFFVLKTQKIIYAT